MKIGLTLGSGAAKGWAHIGIIRALEEMGVQIDLVAGCSIGAYVGAAYCSGKLDALETWANALTDWQSFSMIGFGINKGSLASGQKIFTSFAEEFSVAEFSQLSKPLGVVATDIHGGKEVRFVEGSVETAIRASCAIPALFPPVFHENRWLVDGAVVNPVPINLCHQMGADFVIAVNLGAHIRTPYHTQISIQQAAQQGSEKEDANLPQRIQRWLNVSGEHSEKQDKPASPSLLHNMSNAMDILQNRVTRASLSAEPPELLIEPHLNNYGIMDFAKAPELIQQGYDTVQRIKEQIIYALKLEEKPIS
jgi:NTE family protein